MLLGAAQRLPRCVHLLAPVDLDRLVPEIIEQYPQFQEKSDFIHVARPLPKVSGNTALLTQVFSNLLGNALKFVQAGREPQVRVRENNSDHVRIWIEDNGIGIPADQRERIFGLFQRLHRPNEYAGTGVGLAVVKRAVEKMGGAKRESRASLGAAAVSGLICDRPISQRGQERRL